MKTFEWKDFSRGWVPSADSFACPRNGLLRMDNLVLDEGILALRRGSRKVNSQPIQDVRINTLFSTNLRFRDGTTRRMRLAGADNAVWSNQEVAGESPFHFIIGGMNPNADGDPDISFARYLNQIFITRGGRDGPQPWTAATAYALHDIIQPFPFNEFIYRCTTTGTTGNTAPIFPTVVGDTVTDGTVVWTCQALKQAWRGNNLSHFKYDIETVRNWGISVPERTPTIRAFEPDGKTFATCSSTESPGFTSNEGTQTFAADRDSVANASVQIVLDATTFRGTSTLTFGSATDFTAYDAGGVGNDDDVIEQYIYISEPNKLDEITLMVDVENGDFTQDYYYFTWKANEDQEVRVEVPRALEHEFEAEGYEREAALDRIEIRRTATTTFRPDLNSWNYISAARGQFTRVGTSTEKNWSTVKAIRVVAHASAAITVRFDNIRIVGGGAKPLKGAYKWRYVYVYNNGTYVAKSPPSAPTDEAILENRGAGIGVTASPDPQVSAIWVYRHGGTMDAYYRTIEGPNVTAELTDITSDQDALVLNERMETDNVLPPDHIIGVEVHAERLWCLTRTHLYMSRQRNPDSFGLTQAIRIGDDTESALWLKRATSGLYVGTDKDIYRIAGDAVEYPDGTLNVRKESLNIGNPPVAKAAAQEGNFLAYLASDGWRVLTGQDNPVISESVRLLYQGQDRHGVEAINLDNWTVHHVAAISRQQLVAVTMEGGDFSASRRIHRYDFSRNVWYRHTYPADFRCVARETDGTLLAGDTLGTIWELDSGIDDDGQAIPIVLRTGVDDYDTQDRRKIAQAYSLHAVNNDTLTIALHLDGAPQADATLSMPPRMLPQENDLVGFLIGGSQQRLDGVSDFLHIQQRITGSFNTFKFYGYSLTYLEKVLGIHYWENRPVSPSPRRRRFGGLTVLVDSQGQDVSVIPVLDGVAQSAQTINTTEPLVKSLTITSAVGRDLWARVSTPIAFGLGHKRLPFEVYSADPIIMEELPQQFKGRINDSNFGYEGEKVMSGLALKVCTQNASVTFTPIVDDANQTTFALTTELDEPDTYIHKFTAAVTGTDIALSTNGNVELYEFKPIVLYNLPRKRRVHDTGQVDLESCGHVWLREICLKARAAANLTLTVYIDEVAVSPASTVTAIVDKTELYSVMFGREVKGRQFQVQITSASDFMPYWLEFRYRLSGTESQKKTKRISLV